MAHSYAHLYGLPVIGLRFFTVYGPWGRPDMAPVLFACAIKEGKAIRVFNHGNHRRDFTYVEDVVTGVVAVSCHEPNASEISSPPPGGQVRTGAPFRIYNIGNSAPVKLMEFLFTLEQCMGKKAHIELADAQPGDVLDTWADCRALERDYSYRPNTPLAEGMQRFVDWFKDYYKT
jgi:UDP-glucuronate 4-epimerase